MYTTSTSLAKSLKSHVENFEGFERLCCTYFEVTRKIRVVLICDIDNQDTKYV